MSSLPIPSSQPSKPSMSSHSPSVLSVGRPPKSTKWYDTLASIKSYVGSEIEFRLVDHNHSVTATLVDYDSSGSLRLSKAVVNHNYLGDHVLFDSEVSVWRVKRFVRAVRTKNTARASTVSDKVYIPLDLSDDEYENQVNPELEAIDLNEDEELIDINLRALTLPANEDIRVFREDSDKKLVMDAINSIERSRYSGVGFAMFGESTQVTRDETIDLLVFATNEAIFVFDAHLDIVCLLKPILESQQIQKIVHSCRHLSDSLWHQFGIKLANVCDVRVIDYYLQQKVNRLFDASNRNIRLLPPKPALHSYEECLQKYLGINRVPKVRNELNYKEITNRVKNVIRIRTVFLRELSAIINFELTKEIIISTDRCLNSLREANDIEYQMLIDDNCEKELIENPLNQCENNIEKQIWYNGLNGLVRRNGLSNGTLDMNNLTNSHII